MIVELWTQSTLRAARQAEELETQRRAARDPGAVAERKARRKQVYDDANDAESYW